MADPVITPAILQQLVNNDGTPTIFFTTWLDEISTLLNALVPLTGIGTPEGIENASVGRFYVDTSAPVGSGIYFKESGDTSTGWILRS